MNYKPLAILSEEYLLLDEEMRRLMFIFAIVVSLSFNLRANTCDWVDEIISDSLWIQWFLPKHDNNVEIIEMRNEYLFCRLLSTECCSFLEYLSSSIDDDVTRAKIGKELQNPIHDDINIKTCVQKILSCPTINNSFKIWLVDNIKQKTGGQSHAQDTILCDSPYAPFLDLRPVVLLDPDYDGNESIWDETMSMVIDSLHHDFLHELFIELHVDSCRNGMIHVQPFWSIGDRAFFTKGWVALSDRIITYSASDILPLYVYPSCDSIFTETQVYVGERIHVMDFYKGWIYTTFKDASGNNISGWIPRLYQCPNVYTTCN